MEDKCEVCENSAEVSCFCDSSLRFCREDFSNVHKKVGGNHESIELTDLRKEMNIKFVNPIENLKKVKKEIISKSNDLILIIQIIAKSKLALIKKYADCCKKALKHTEADAEKKFKLSEKIKIEDSELKFFIKHAKKNLSISGDDNKIIDFEYENLLCETQLSSIMHLKSSQEKLQSNCILEGHSEAITSIVVTKDSKYIISGSEDNTIRI